MRSIGRSIYTGFVLGLAFATTAPAAVVTVGIGESIQAAVDAAAPGDVIKVLPGDYIESHAGIAAVRITKPLKLIAKSTPTEKVRILPDPGNAFQTNGILVEPANPGDPDVDGVLIKGFTVEGFENNGIWLRHVRNFKIKNNESINNLENGIWPTLSANGLVKKNVSYGSQDSALWVEGSENVRVIKNEISDSVTGIEITISENVLVKGNNVHNNTIGVGLYHPSAAGLPATGLEGRWQIVGNTITNNNAPNSAPPGSLASELPSGGGILLLGVDDNLIQGNTVSGNDFFGIAMIDWCLGVDCSSNPPVDPDTTPDNNTVVGNTITGNAQNPPGPPFGPLASDVLLIGGAGNCFSGNTVGTSIPSPLPGC